MAAKKDEEETTIDHAEWLLRALEKRSPLPVRKMAPTHTLAVKLELDDLDFRNLTNSMRNYIRQRNPKASLAKAEVEKAKTIRGELQLMILKIEDRKLADNEADEAIEEAKKRFPDEEK